MNNAQNWATQLLKAGKIAYNNDEDIGESIAYAEREDLTAFKVSRERNILLCNFVHCLKNYLLFFIIR